jgi:hypothetical protein
MSRNGPLMTFTDQTTFPNPGSFTAEITTGVPMAGETLNVESKITVGKAGQVDQSTFVYTPSAGP